jgi:uncharacterized protein involved in exopolysaccharide biosynthesis
MTSADRDRVVLAVVVLVFCLAMALAFAASRSYEQYVRLMDTPITQGTPPLPPPTPRAKR